MRKHKCITCKKLTFNKSRCNICLKKLKKNYEYCKIHGKCRACGANINRGKTICKKCKIKNNKTRREQYSNFKNNGLCVTCGINKSEPNKTRCKQCSKKTTKWAIKRYEKNPSKILWLSAKDRAHKNHEPFNIEVSDVIIPKKCPILDIKLKRGRGVHCETSPTIDKIIPKLGYIKGNVQVVSHLGNLMKQNATPKCLLKFADWSYRTFKK